MKVAVTHDLFQKNFFLPLVYCRVTKHRREVIEPELLQEGSESETEARGRREEEDSDAENEDLDEEVCDIKE